MLLSHSTRRAQHIRLHTLHHNLPTRRPAQQRTPATRQPHQPTLLTHARSQHHRIRRITTRPKIKKIIHRTKPQRQRLPCRPPKHQPPPMLHTRHRIPHRLPKREKLPLPTMMHIKIIPIRQHLHLTPTILIQTHHPHII